MSDIANAASRYLEMHSRISTLAREVTRLQEALENIEDELNILVGAARLCPIPPDALHRYLTVLITNVRDALEVTS
jgi:hypothetical protein